MPFDTIRMGSSAAGAYEIERSLRFNESDSTSCTRTPSSAGNRKTWTFSCWIKKSDTDNTAPIFLGGVDTNNYLKITIGGDDKLYVMYNDSGAYNENFRSNRVFIDTSAWINIVVAWDTTQGTADNRITVYINGTSISGVKTNTPAQNYDGPINNTVHHDIGRATYNAGEWFNGYITEIHHIDGTRLDATSFGKTDAVTGQWIPKKYSGSYGTNGFYLNFSDNSNTTAGTLGADSSGNGNNFTPSNFSVASGPGNDSVLDTPTNNYCTLDPVDVKDSIIVDGALSTATTEGGGHQPNFSTFGLTSGKWYVEGGKITSNASTVCVWPKEHDEASLDQDNAVHNNAGNQNAKGYGFNLNYGSATHTPSNTITNYTSTSFTTWMLALDLDNGKIWWGVDGTWGNNGGTGDPAAGSNPAFSSGFAGEIWTVGSMTTSGHNISFNFGQQGFAHTPPTGFKPMCTQNLPDPPIKDPTKYFNTVIYDGDGQDNRTVSGVGFDPDFIWVKETTGTNGASVSEHLLQDTVKGITWSGNTTNRDAWTNDSRVKSTNSDGFVTGNDNTINGSSKDYVAWNWLESATAGFDIVKFDGTEANRTVAHNLGVAPHMMVFKNTEQDSQEWAVYHKDVGAGMSLNLDDNTLGVDNAIFYNDTEPTSSVFTVGTATSTNGDGDEMIGYLWTGVEGYSRFGLAYGTGDKDEGPFVWTGFKPAFVLTKGFNGTASWSNNANWDLWDNKRSPGGWAGNYKNSPLYPDYEGGNENYNPDTGASPVCEFHAHGFRYYTSHGYVNQNDKPFFYMAFAETPFKYANSQ